MVCNSIYSLEDDNTEDHFKNEEDVLTHHRKQDVEVKCMYRYCVSAHIKDKSVPLEWPLLINDRPNFLKVLHSI